MFENTLISYKNVYQQPKQSRPYITDYDNNLNSAPCYQNRTIPGIDRGYKLLHNHM